MLDWTPRLDADGLAISLDVFGCLSVFRRNTSCQETSRTISGVSARQER